MRRLLVRTIIFAVVIGCSSAWTQTHLNALYPSEGDLETICLAFMEDSSMLPPMNVPALQAEQLIEAFDRIVLLVLTPVYFFAQACVNNGRHWGYPVEQLLANQRYNIDAVTVVLQRPVRNTAFAMNHWAVLVVRDPSGNESANLSPDPWRSNLMSEDWRGMSNGEENTASLFTFPINDPVFREAIEAGGTLHVMWKAGPHSRGEWEWPIGFGDCTGDLIRVCQSNP